MLDRNDRRHAVSHVGPVKFWSFPLKYYELPRVAVDDRRKLRLEASQMRAALRIVDVIAESQHIFMELVDMPETHPRQRFRRFRPEMR